MDQNIEETFRVNALIEMLDEAFLKYAMLCRTPSLPRLHSFHLGSISGMLNSLFMLGYLEFKAYNFLHTVVREWLHHDEANRRVP